MSDIDPITREALRRASQMQNRTNRSSSPPESEPRTKSERHHSHPNPPEPPPPPKPPGTFGGLDALFKDKETSVILILIILLMGEKGSEHLLLALIYLLI